MVPPGEPTTRCGGRTTGLKNGNTKSGECFLVRSFHRWMVDPNTRDSRCCASKPNQAVADTAAVVDLLTDGSQSSRDAALVMTLCAQRQRGGKGVTPCALLLVLLVRVFRISEAHGGDTPPTAPPKRSVFFC